MTVACWKEALLQRSVLQIHTLASESPTQPVSPSSLLTQARVTIVLPETQVRCILSINDTNAEAVNEYYELDFEIGNTNILYFKIMIS